MSNVTGPSSTAPRALEAGLEAGRLMSHPVTVAPLVPSEEGPAPRAIGRQKASRGTGQQAITGYFSARSVDP